jgi:chemotaxis protein histidine kinase CheA
MYLYICKMSDNKVIYKCSKCAKIYKGKAPFEKHEASCKSKTTTVPVNLATPTMTMNSTPQVPPTPQKMNENNYDINMTFGEGNKVHVDMKKQPAAKQPAAKQPAAKQQASADEETDSDEESGEKVLKDLLRPKVSETYQIEIDKLENLIKMFKHLPISEDPAKKDHAIEQLKATITILMTQAQSLIKEMKQMSRRNSYYKNNIMLATFILDKCRMDAPETEEDFENMFGEGEAEK